MCEQDIFANLPYQYFKYMLSPSQRRESPFRVLARGEGTNLTKSKLIKYPPWLTNKPRVVISDLKNMVDNQK